MIYLYLNYYTKIGNIPVNDDSHSPIYEMIIQLAVEVTSLLLTKNFDLVLNLNWGDL